MCWVVGEKMGNEVVWSWGIEGMRWLGLAVTTMKGYGQGVHGWRGGRVERINGGRWCLWFRMGHGGQMEGGMFPVQSGKVWEVVCSVRSTERLVWVIVQVAMGGCWRQVAAKILANLIVMGSGILARAFVQAYRQALAIARLKLCAFMDGPSTSTKYYTVVGLKFWAFMDGPFTYQTIMLYRDKIHVQGPPALLSIWLISDASKSGVAQETIQNAARRASKTMTEQEARQILGVSEQSTWEEIAQKYDNLFERNAKIGSFYLQSKVHRAKECLEPLYQQKDQGTAA
ncbi:hypothetical protein U1Q18_030499 [Sarracenia purpurea var. burkii]